jgi:hypothetical protein
MRFDQLDVTKREIIHMFRQMSRANVSHLTPIRRFSSNAVRYEEHTVHACEHRLCPITCQLCKRLCNGDHLHGLSRGENHICGYAHQYLSFTSLFTGPLAKNTHVVPYVPLLEYAKSIQLPSQLRLRSLEGTKPFSTPR